MTSHRPLHAVLLGTVVLVVVVVGALGVVFHLDGGRWYAVTSPSMGETLPTGSFLVSAPTAVAEVADGDLITFRSPGSGTVFSHRVVAHTDTGLTTRGDVNLADDAWTITDDDLIGKVIWHAPGLGWLLRGVPLLFVGLAVTWLLTLAVRESRRYPLRIIGSTLTVAVVSWLLDPWVGLDRLTQTTPADGSKGVLLKVISTGLLPIEAFEVDGDASAKLNNGEISTLHLTQGKNGNYDLAARLDVSWWGWVLLALIVLTPLLWTLLRGLPPLPGPQNANTATDTEETDTGADNDDAVQLEAMP